MKRMERISDSTDKQVATTGQKSQGDWRKAALYNLSPERHHPENTSEAAQERTSSPSDRNIEPDVDIPFSNRRQTERRQHWEVNRSYSGVAAASSDSPGYRQGSEAKSGHDDGTSNTSELGELKGGFGEWADNAMQWGVNKWTKGEKQWRVTFGKKSEHRPGMYKLKPED